uniref:Uncharacterized protein n=1 Tax=Petromyzon marinus TaxID=7757 RepID=S4RR44_PETMA
GALDLGGASTQITFMTEEPLQGSPDSLTIQLYGRKYHVYSHSYLCYGRDQAIKRFLSTLYKKASSGAHVNNPCYPTLYSVAYNLSFIYDSPCTSDARPANYDPNQSVTFRGTANPAECSNTISSIFNFSACSSPNCTFDGVWQPPVRGHFLAFSSFYHAMAAFNLTNPKPPLNDATNAFDYYCRKTWNELVSRSHPLDSNHCYCYRSTCKLLFSKVSIYNYDKESWENINFQKEAGGGELGWALGFMLNVTNMVPVGKLPELYSTAAVGFSLIFTIAIFLAVALASYLAHNRNASAKDKRGDNH